MRRSPASRLDSAPLAAIIRHSLFHPPPGDPWGSDVGARAGRPPSPQRLGARPRAPVTGGVVVKSIPTRRLARGLLVVAAAGASLWLQFARAAPDPPGVIPAVSPGPAGAPQLLPAAVPPPAPPAAAPVPAAPPGPQDAGVLR